MYLKSHSNILIILTSFENTAYIKSLSSLVYSHNVYFSEISAYTNWNPMLYSLVNPKIKSTRCNTLLIKL